MHTLKFYLTFTVQPFDVPIPILVPSLGFVQDDGPWTIILPSLTLSLLKALLFRYCLKCLFHSANTSGGIAALCVPLTPLDFLFPLGYIHVFLCYFDKSVKFSLNMFHLHYFLISFSGFLTVVNKRSLYASQSNSSQ